MGASRQVGVVICLFCSLAAARGANPAAKYAVVRARVVEVNKNQESSITNATLEVIHVYYGDEKLLKSKFSDFYAKVDFHGIAAREDFTLHEEGIWSLRPDKDATIITRVYGLPFEFRCRNVKGEDGDRYVHILELVETIEKYTKSKSGDRPALAEKLAGHTNPEIGYWMIRTLGDSDMSFAGDMLKKWRKKPETLPIKAQVALDEVLCSKEAESWYFDEERASLLKRWVTGDMDSTRARLVLDRLNVASQNRQLRGNKAAEFLQTAALNKGWKSEDRQMAVRFIGAVAGREVDHHDAFAWLFDQIRSHPDSEMRRTAAVTLAQLPLHPKRLKAVEDHLASEKDAEIVKTLRAAVQKVKAADKK